jgi:hypothetical protein
MYHLREAQILYPINLTLKNSELRAENTYFLNDNSYILIKQEVK